MNSPQATWLKKSSVWRTSKRESVCVTARYFEKRNWRVQHLSVMSQHLSGQEFIKIQKGNTISLLGRSMHQFHPSGTDRAFRQCCINIYVTRSYWGRENNTNSFSGREPMKKLTGSSKKVYPWMREFPLLTPSDTTQPRTHCFAQPCNPFWKTHFCMGLQTVWFIAHIMNWD